MAKIKLVEKCDGFYPMTSDEFKKPNPVGWIELVDGSIALYKYSRVPDIYPDRDAAEEVGNVLCEAYPSRKSRDTSRKLKRPTKSYLKQYAEDTYERGFEEEYKDFVQVCLEDGFVVNEEDYETYLDFYDSYK